MEISKGKQFYLPPSGYFISNGPCFPLMQLHVAFAVLYSEEREGGHSVLHTNTNSRAQLYSFLFGWRTLVTVELGK